MSTVCSKPRGFSYTRFCAMLLAILLVQVLCGALTSGMPKTSRQGRRLCATPECFHKAKQIRDTLSTTIDPCEDFYEYACQRWIADNPLPEDKGSHTTFDEVREEVQLELKETLENATCVTYQQEQQNITQKLILAYETCKQEGSSETDELQELRDLLDSLSLSAWPADRLTAGVPGWQEMFLTLASRVGLTPIFSIGVSQDVKNTSANILQMDQLSFDVIGRNQLINQTTKHNSPIVEAYKAYIKGAAKIMSSTTLGEDRLNSIAQDILDFETELAKRSRSQEDRRNYLKMYRKVNMTQLQVMLPQVRWVAFLNTILKTVNVTIEEDEEAVMWEMDYYRFTLHYLNTQERSVIYNYFGWVVLLHFGTAASEKIRVLKDAFDKVASGTSKRKDRWKRCIDDLQVYAAHAIGRLFIEQKFTSRAKLEMDSMVATLKQTYHEMIEEETWMDDATKNVALRKVSAMTTKIGYADWLKNDTHLSQLYKYVDAFDRSTPYVDMLASLSKNYYRTALAKLHRPYDKRKEWLTGAAVVNAFYDPSSNEIIFPAGILQPPFYEYGLPISLNMGGIGMIIGHEITHAFDDTGSQFDAQGCLRNWWTNSTREEFKEKAQCIINQYGNITDSITGDRLNGINTQGENIADNGGLRGAYRAYRKLLIQQNREDDALPGLGNLTGDQMFFISNARVWCAGYRIAALRRYIQYNNHSPSRYRVNIPMQNLPEFSDAFNCPSESAMNPSHRCRVW